MNNNTTEVNAEPKLAKQASEVLDFLRKNKTITSMQAIMELRCTRISARIWDLRHAGFRITGVLQTKKEEDGSTTRWMEYALHE